VARAHPNVRAAVGIHPNHAHEFELADLPLLREIQSDPCVIALGEMGLDYHHNFAPRDRQAEVFQAQLQLATELGRPVVLHSREAIADTLAILRAFPKVRAVFHSFTGTPDEARAILDQGYFIGFTGPVTYKKNDALREAARLTPLDRLLVETDAPYLSPEPVRSQRTCEPAFVQHTAGRIAEIKGVDLRTLDRAITNNAASLFGWPRYC
jgi:TatD DNase family protein